MSRLSVRLKATLAATAIVGVALGVASAVLIGVLSSNLEDSAELEAARRAKAAAVELVRIPPGDPAEASDPDVKILATRQGGDVAFAPPGSWVTAYAPASTPQGVVIVQARASLEPARATLATLQSMLVPGIPALLLLVAGLTWVAVGRALAPVSAIRRELADITASDLHRRVPEPKARDEIALLAQTTNRTLDRLERAVGKHQRFVADAAHELRSPLAVLRARLEIAPRQQLTTEALSHGAMADVDRIQRLAADLLLLARLDADEPPGSDEVELGQVAAEEAVRTRPRSDVDVGMQIGAGVVVRGSGEELRRLVANLVDNAVRHATRMVVVRLMRSGGHAVLDVGDDGPGIPVDQREAVFDRFTRLDEARARDAGGSGLGLAIARDIAVRHGGSLAVVSGPPGGHLRARLPLG
jgi:signal transduction histidine kinase